MQSSVICLVSAVLSLPLGHGDTLRVERRAPLAWSDEMIPKLRYGVPTCMGMRTIFIVLERQKSTRMRDDSHKALRYPEEGGYPGVAQPGSRILSTEMWGFYAS